MMYTDDYSIIDTQLILCVHLVEGDGAHDGRYGIAYLLMIAGKSRRVFVDYPDKTTRDKAFQALRTVVREEALDGEEG